MAQVLIKVAEKLIAEADFGKYDRLAWLIVPHYVDCYGREEIELSLEVLEKTTELASAEFAIRTFIEQQPEMVMNKMLAWSKHPNYHVRRLASEGSRPRLPWGKVLRDFKKNPEKVLPILENLRKDFQDYVYRSVANNLNDISKDSPELVLDVVESWLKEGFPHANWIARHACRTLLKKSYPRSLQLFGYEPVDVSQLKYKIVSESVTEQSPLRVMVELEMDQERLIRLEYTIHYLKKNGKHQSKTFLVSDKVFSKGTHKLEFKQSFRSMTTRKHYRGEHFLAIKMNGRYLPQKKFRLD